MQHLSPETGSVTLEVAALIIVGSICTLGVLMHLGVFAALLHILSSSITGHTATASAGVLPLRRARHLHGGVSAVHAHDAAHHAALHGRHAASAVSSWPGASEVSQFISAHGAGFLVPIALGAVGICLASTVIRVCFGYYLRTDRASWSILDNNLTLALFGVGAIALAAALAPSAGFGGSLLHDLGSLIGAHSGSVGGGA